MEVVTMMEVVMMVVIMNMMMMCPSAEHKSRQRSKPLYRSGLPKIWTNSTSHPQGHQILTRSVGNHLMKHNAHELLNGLSIEISCV